MRIDAHNNVIMCIDHTTYSHSYNTHEHTCTHIHTCTCMYTCIHACTTDDGIR